METKYNAAKTTKDYTTKFDGYEITVPKGSRVSNSTACGADNAYHFWTGWHKQVQEITGFKDSMLAHDLTYYGLNIPGKYCEKYR